MPWYVKHRLRDQSVETFRYDSHARARQICSDLHEADEIAWIEDEQRRALPDWKDRRD